MMSMIRKLARRRQSFLERFQLQVPFGFRGPLTMRLNGRVDERLSRLRKAFEPKIEKTPPKD